MREIFERLIRPHTQRVRQLIGLAILDLVEPYTGLLRVQADIVGDDTRIGNVMQHYGFASIPLKGAQGVRLAVGGDANHVVIVAMDDGNVRPQDLAQGEVCLYTDEGDRVWFKRGRIISVAAGTKLLVSAPEVEVQASTKVTLNTPLTETTGDLSVGGDITSTGNVSDSHGSLAALRGDYNAANYPLPGGGFTGTTNRPS